MPRDLIAELNNNEPQIQDISQVQNLNVPQQTPQIQQPQSNDSNSLLGSLVKNTIMGGVELGANLGEAPYRIAKSLADRGIINENIPETIHKYVHEYPGARESVEKLIGAENPNFLERTLRTAVGAAPLVYATGGIAGGALTGLTQSDTPFQSALLGGALGAIPSGLGKLMPGRLAKSMVNSSREKYTDLYRGVQQEYKNLFDASGNNNVLENGIPVTGKEMSPKLADYIANDASSDINKNFISNPTAENSHYLKTKIGSDIGDLQRQSYLRKLDPDEVKQIKTLKNIRDEVEDMTTTALGKSGDQYSQAYKNLGDYYKNTVLPHEYLAKALTKLGEDARPQSIWNTVDKLSRKNAPALTDIKYNPPVPKEYLTLNDVLKSKISGQKIANKVMGYGLKFGLPMLGVEEFLRRR